MPFLWDFVGLFVNIKGSEILVSDPFVPILTYVEGNLDVDRKAMQRDLIFKLGLLFSPLKDVLANPAKYDNQTKNRIGEKYEADKTAFLAEVESFCHDENGDFYSTEYKQVAHEFFYIRGGLTGLFSSGRFSPTTARLEGAIPRIINAIEAIPIIPIAKILPANSPFSTYCTMKDLCNGTKQRLVWVDAYPVDNLFYRYLRDIGKNVKVTIVTNPPLSGQGNLSRYRAFLDESKLYAVERGAAYYTLIEYPNLHDRWLRCDDALYHLGGSVKDASQKSDYSLSRLDPTPENLQTIEDKISGGKELFGPNQPDAQQHP